MLYMYEAICNCDVNVLIKWQQHIKVYYWTSEMKNAIKVSWLDWLILKLNSPSCLSYLCDFSIEALPAFRFGNSMSQPTELLFICWWQRSDYVIAWKNDNTANFVLLRQRWWTRGWFDIRFCMNSITIINSLSKASGQLFGSFSVGRPAVTLNNTK